MTLLTFARLLRRRPRKGKDLGFSAEDITAHARELAFELVRQERVGTRSVWGLWGVPKAGA